jgi:hypothetical protein
MLASTGKEPDMTASSVFLLLLFLACPLMMVFMMRGGHGHGHGHAEHKVDRRETSADDLRRQRAELDRLIEEREDAEQQERERELTSWGGARR